MDSLDRSKGRRCPGEETCALPPEESPDSGPIYREVIAKRMGRSAEKVCGECPRIGTKPGRHSPHLSSALHLASHLDRLRQSGASFPYPGANESPFWWTCLVASADGRRRADEARNKRLEDKRKQEELQRKAAEERASNSRRRS